MSERPQTAIDSQDLQQGAAVPDPVAAPPMADTAFELISIVVMAAALIAAIFCWLPPVIAPVGQAIVGVGNFYFGFAAMSLLGFAVFLFALSVFLLLLHGAWRIYERLTGTLLPHRRLLRLFRK